MSVQVHSHIEQRGSSSAARASSDHDAGRKLRVALVASSYNYIRDGVALTLNRLVSYLEDHGAEVLVFAPVGRTPALKHEGTLVPVPSFALPARPEYRFALGLPRRVVDRLRTFRPDLMHIALAPDLMGYSALRTARQLGIPVVASCHTRFETYLKHYWYSTWAERPLKSYMRRAYGACREVYVPSPSMMEAMKADGVATDLKLWPRGIDTGLFSPAKRTQAWRTAHGFAENEFIVTFVSRLVREKELETVVSTLRQLESLGVAHGALIVGDGPERAWLKEQLPRAVFTGFLTGEDLAEAYASSDAFLFPSETETFGNVTLEAMASGLPCVCADATGSRSLVVHDETGYLAEPRNAQMFAERLAGLARHPDLRRKMGEAGRQRALSFSWEETMARILGYYRTLVRDAAP